MEVHIYTDGCCLRNPGGAGGYGTIILCGGKVVVQISKGFVATTNNRMEIMAAIAGIESLREPSKGIVYSDSQYLVHAIESGWIRKWKRNGWRTRTGEPVKNKDLWTRLDTLAAGHALRFSWVRGHNGNPLNEECDLLAGQASRNTPLHVDEGYTDG